MSPTATAKPLIGVSGCQKKTDGHTIYTVGHKYVLAVVNAADAVPVMLPPLGDSRNGGDFDIETVVGRLDGLLVTGSPSNVEPDHYDGPASRPGTLHDPARDATTLPLIRAAIEADLPVLAICRGLQELNVAYGGTLHQHVHELPDKHDHRMPQGPDHDVRYGLRHPVRTTPGGQLADLASEAGLNPDNVMVNSLHAQAIDRLGAGLAVEAVSEDGVIEASRVEGAPAFALGVQWHPEFKPLENPFYAAIFRAFGAACRRKPDERTVARFNSLPA